MLPDELPDLLELLLCRGIGRRAVRRIVIDTLHGGGNLLSARQRLRNLPGFVPASRQELDDARAETERLQLVALRIGDADYPALLAAIPDPPIALFVQGDASALNAALSVAVVGSRRASSAGLQIARVLAADLGRGGVAVVSGLASGVDGAAHAGALESGAVTVAVIGGGHGRLYPAQHRALAARIAQHRGALVSEYPVTIQPRPGHFPERNRIISGLSAGIVVVEATIRSGSLITARMALEQGREVMAVPGSVLGPGHGGCHRLLKEGALLVEGVADVLAVFGVSPAVAKETSLPQDPLLLSVFRALGNASVDAQVLVDRTNLPVDVLLGALVRLELDGFVESGHDGYIRRPSPTGSA